MKVYVITFKFDNGASIDWMQAVVKAKNRREAENLLRKEMCHCSDDFISEIKIREIADNEVIVG